MKRDLILKKFIGISTFVLLLMRIVVSPEETLDLAAALVFGFAVWSFLFIFSTALLIDALIIRQGRRFGHQWWKKRLVYFLFLSCVLLILVYSNSHLLLFRCL